MSNDHLRLRDLIARWIGETANPGRLGGVEATADRIARDILTARWFAAQPMPGDQGSAIRDLSELNIAA